MSNKMSLHDLIGERCKHFTGLYPGHDRCDAGVLYDDVMDRSTIPYRFPCIKSDNCASRCAHVSYPTKQEITEQEKKILARGAEALNNLGKGLCPTCGQPMEWQETQGHSAYALPCGHRIGRIG